MRKALYNIGWWLQEVVKLTLIGLLLMSIATSGWKYEMVNGQEMRCFSIQLPGYEEYIDWNHGTTKINRVFSLHAHYRLGPWINPEWVEEDTHAEP